MNIHKRIKRAKRIRRKLKNSNVNRFRLSVFRSSKNISAQIIDDINNKTLVSASSIKSKGESKKNKTDLSVLTAEMLAKKAIEQKITKVFFDRGGYKFHGRIKTIPETLRKNALII